MAKYQRKKKAPARRKRVTVKQQPLIFANPFRSTHFIPVATPSFTSRLNLDDAVQSVEAAEEQRDIQRRMDRYNAKIYTQKERALKQIAQIQEKRKMERMLRKVAQAQSMTDEQLNKLHLDREGIAKAARILSTINKPTADILPTENLFKELEKINEVGEGVMPIYRRIHKMSDPNKDALTPVDAHANQRAIRDARRLIFRKYFTQKYGKEPTSETVKDAIPDIADMSLHTPGKSRFLTHKLKPKSHIVLPSFNF